MDPPLHRSLVRRWMQRTCHTLEAPIGHCALLLQGTPRAGRSGWCGRNISWSWCAVLATDWRLASSPALAGRALTELLYRKCSLAASLAVAAALELGRTGLLQLARSTWPESEEREQVRRRLERQAASAERMAQCVYLRKRARVVRIR
jgi:hypothetical protein